MFLFPPVQPGYSKKFRKKVRKHYRVIRTQKPICFKSDLSFFKTVVILRFCGYNMCVHIYTHTHIIYTVSCIYFCL